MSDHSSSTKATNSHAPTSLGSVAKTSNHQKIEPIDYTADESMIADFMAVLPQLDPSDSSSTATSPTLKIRGHSNDSSKSINKFDAFAVAAAVQHQLFTSSSGLSTVQSSSSSPPTNQLDYQNNNNNKRKRKIDRPAQKRIRGSYKLVSPEQKVRIHEYAEKHGVKAASKLFQVAPSTIASWLYQKPNGERTSAIRNKEAHSRILEWIQTRQENGERVNNRDFHSYALATMRELTGNPDFAASRSWCSNFIKKYNIQLDSDKQADSTSAQFRFDSVDDNASESSQCYMGGNSTTDVLSDDDDMNTNHQMTNHSDNQQSPNSDQTVNRSNSLSPQQIINGTDDVSTTTPVVIKVEQENDFNCTSPSSPSVQPLSNKMTVTSVPIPSSKRLPGTLNRLLNSVISRPNGHHYHYNGLSSSPSASSSTTTAAAVDSVAKEPKTSLEMSTQSIETFVQHFDSSFNTMTYFQEKLQHLLVSIAQERDTYRTLYLKEHDRRIAAELRLKENNNPIA
ncbi:unnamed protein product [Adineta steineri]|uniref:HTH CENPB-type domain-containing protein n=1 Tax=Adineta steineri TaxID=433720 RepID=A0A813W813_9BILA|nr:unnamed protein product [Adineta steineri]